MIPPSDDSVNGVFFHSSPGDSILPSMKADGHAAKVMADREAHYTVINEGCFPRGVALNILKS